MRPHRPYGAAPTGGHRPAGCGRLGLTGASCRRIWRRSYGAPASAPHPCAAPKAVGARAARAPCRCDREIKVIGLRRLIAQRERGQYNIHFAYVEELDIPAITAPALNRKPPAVAALTYLPLHAGAGARARGIFGATPRRQRGVLVRAAPCTGMPADPGRLKVPVVHDARGSGSGTSPRRCAASPRRRARNKGQARGSAVQPSPSPAWASSAALHADHPRTRVAIIGVNRAVERPLVIDGTIAIRLTMTCPPPSTTASSMATMRPP